jgi:opacity protein-like surface antigen
MGGIRALIAVGALSLITPSIVHAADVLPEPPLLKAPIVHAEPEFSGWYLRGDMGVGIWQSVEHKSTFSTPGHIPGFRTVYTDLDGGTFAGFGAGYKVNSWFRADLTGEYRARSTYSALNGYTGAAPGCIDCFAQYRANVHGGVFLANGYFDLGTWSGVTPFVGLGVGMAYNVVNNITSHNVTTGTGFGHGPGNTKWGFAWAAMAGLSYAVTRNVHLEMSYRYLDRGRADTGPINCANAGPGACNVERQSFRVVSHDLRMGMRWMFADTPSARSVPIFSRF